MAKFFCCPNCFAQFEKDDSILMFSSGASIVGEGISWSGNLERDIDKIKRVKYCKSCRQPLDFHALLRGQLDYWAWGPSCAVLAFLLTLGAFWFWLDYSFWASLALAAIAATAGGFGGSWLERKRLACWRISENDLARLTAP
ncbi:MAG: hypothetical protein ACREC3_07155 [Methyloceanibacter sp.]